MNTIRSFGQLVSALQQKGEKPRVAVVCPYDVETTDAVAEALANGMVRVLLIGDKEKIVSTGLQIKFPDAVEIIDVKDKTAAASKAVEICKSREADILMKGLIGTDDLLRAILNKENGLLEKGKLLTHLTVAEIPGMDRLLFFSDAAVIPYPTLEQRRQMISLDLDVMRAFGISKPRVALLHFTEKVNPKFPNSVDYQEIIKDAEQGDFGEVEIAGPMDVKTAVDRHSAQVKGLQSEVCGKADLLIFPNIESGNTFYKTISYFAHANMGGMLLGPEVPVVVPSRSDSAKNKLNSLALAALASKAKV